MRRHPEPDVFRNGNLNESNLDGKEPLRTEQSRHELNLTRFKLTLSRHAVVINRSVIKMGHRLTGLRSGN
jgi:hypothetical protein